MLGARVCLWAVPAMAFPLSSGSSRGSHQASAAEEMVLRSSKQPKVIKTVSDSRKMPEETKAKKKQNRKKKYHNPQPYTFCLLSL